MRAIAILSLMLGPSILLFSQAAEEIPANKKSVITSVENHKDRLIEISDQIWGFAELAFEEIESSKVLADYAESQGFQVERGVAEMPTAFIASYGSGSPIIGDYEYKAILPEGPPPIPVKN
jgi:aminobenzoyl-glutamate utilization protein B